MLKMFLLDFFFSYEGGGDFVSMQKLDKKKFYSSVCNRDASWTDERIETKIRFRLVPKFAKKEEKAWHFFDFYKFLKTVLAMFFLT